MTLYEDLYDEYEEAINMQNIIIKKNNRKLKAAREENNFKEIKRLNSLLLVLYEERSELMERADGLKQYIN